MHKLLSVAFKLEISNSAPVSESIRYDWYGVDLVICKTELDAFGVQPLNEELEYIRSSIFQVVGLCLTLHKVAVEGSLENRRVRGHFFVNDKGFLLGSNVDSDEFMRSTRAGQRLVKP
jgi:hypothetical protein